MNETILTILVVVAVTAIFTFFMIKKRNEVWSGVLEDKKIKTTTDEDGFSKDTYQLRFKTDEGKKKNINVNRKKFEEFEVGTRYIKEKGSFIPRAE